MSDLDINTYAKQIWRESARSNKGSNNGNSKS